MANSLHLAGILQYSKPLYDKIEAYLLKLYATLFVPTLEKAANNAEAVKDRLLGKLDDLEQTVQGFGGDPRDLDKIFRKILPLVMEGVFSNQDLDLASLTHPDPRVREMATKQFQKSIAERKRIYSKKLDQDAKEMRADIHKWKKHFDPKFADKVEKAIKQDKAEDVDFEIELSPEDFDFLGEKFQRSVQKARGPDASFLDEIPKITVKMRNLGQGMAGAWNGREHELLVQVPNLTPFESTKRSLHHTLSHELRHMTQTVMSKALGIQQFKLDEKGEPVPFYQASPGMPPRKVQNLDITQALTRGIPELADRRNEIMRQHQLAEDRAVYNLDDMEFYTHLADRVMEIEDAFSKLPWGPKEKKLAQDLYTGAKQIPLTSRGAAVAWVQKHDPNMAVVGHVPEADMFFKHLKDHKPEKWKKAVKEFSKATAKHMKQDPDKGSVHELWQKFLKENYDGGKAKVQNPNPKTRERYPEITVSYLMGRSEPPYQGARQKIRQEFARWRAQDKGFDFAPPPRAPSRRPR